MDNPKWSDIYTANEWSAVLDAQSELLAKRFGAYSISKDLRHAAECIRDLAEQVEMYKNAGAELVRRVMLGRESLGRAPEYIGLGHPEQPPERVLDRTSHHDIEEQP